MSEPFSGGPPPMRPAETPWQRLDPRMLLVHPVREVIKFLPVIIGLYLARIVLEWFGLM